MTGEDSEYMKGRETDQRCCQAEACGMPPQEWRDYAIKRIEHGASAIAEGRQALIDARKALDNAGEGMRATELDGILYASLLTAPRLQDLLNAMRADPPLEEHAQCSVCRRRHGPEVRHECE